MADHPKDVFEALFGPWTDRIDLEDIRRDLRKLSRVVARHEDKIAQMRIHMAATDDLVERLTLATDELASDLSALAAEVSGGDATIAAKFEPLVSRLEALGRENDTPPVDVPPVEPTA